MRLIFGISFFFHTNRKFVIKKKFDRNFRLFNLIFVFKTFSLEIIQLFLELCLEKNKTNEGSHWFFHQWLFYGIYVFLTFIDLHSNWVDLFSFSNINCYFQCSQIDIEFHAKAPRLWMLSFWDLHKKLDRKQVCDCRGCFQTIKNPFKSIHNYSHNYSQCFHARCIVVMLCAR